MPRKKRVAQTEITTELLKFRAKRRWQITLRRYLLQKSPCTAYAPYFGIDILNFRAWLELQFDQTLNWENFGSAWQFDHIIPVTYFDFESDLEMRMCWNFINIRAQNLKLNHKKEPQVDIPGAKRYFQSLYEETRFPQAQNLLNKLTEIETSEIASTRQQQSFIRDRLTYLITISDFVEYEFDRLNYGISVEDILLTRELVNKYK